MSNKPVMTGWEAVLKIMEPNIKAKSDYLMVLIHWVLIYKRDFTCLGIGSETKMDKDEEGSELLPDGWQNDETMYTLRYAKNNKLYILLGIKSTDIFIINFLDAETQYTSNYTIDLTTDVNDDVKGSITKVIPKYPDVIEKVITTLIEPTIMNDSKENPIPVAKRYAEKIVPTNDPLRIGPPRYPRIPMVPNYGEGDLDPFGRAGGGMLYNPGIRPGIRFDPMSPFGDGGDPDNDAFMPPSFGVNPYNNRRPLGGGGGFGGGYGNGNFGGGFM